MLKSIAGLFVHLDLRSRRYRLAELDRRLAELGAVQHVYRVHPHNRSNSSHDLARS